MTMPCPELLKHRKLTEWAMGVGACKACALHVAATLMAKGTGVKPDRACKCIKGEAWKGSTCEEKLRDAYKRGKP